MSLVAVAAGVAVLSGAALQSAVGFGFALVCAPLLYAALSPAEAIGLMIVLALEVNLLTLLGERRRPAPSWPDVRPVVAWSLPGAIAGVAVLRSLDDGRPAAARHRGRPRARSPSTSAPSGSPRRRAPSRTPAGCSPAWRAGR